MVYISKPSIDVRSRQFGFDRDDWFFLKSVLILILIKIPLKHNLCYVFINLIFTQQGMQSGFQIDCQCCIILFKLRCTGCKTQCP